MTVFVIRWYHNDETRAIPKALLVLHRIDLRENKTIHFDDSQEVGNKLDVSRKETVDCKKQVTWQDLSGSFDLFCITFSTVAFLCINLAFVIKYCV